MFGYHPNLTLDAEVERHWLVNPQDVIQEVNGGIDNSSKYVGAIVLGALGTLVALKALGFRFSFGVSAGR